MTSGILWMDYILLKPVISENGNEFKKPKSYGATPIIKVVHLRQLLKLLVAKTAYLKPPPGSSLQIRDLKAKQIAA